MKPILFILLFLAPANVLSQQTGVIKGKVLSDSYKLLADATIGIKEIGQGTFSTSKGIFELSKIPAGTYDLHVSAVGFKSKTTEVQVTKKDTTFITIVLSEDIFQLEQMVVTGTMREVSIKDSPVKVTSISKSSLDKTASNNIMEAIEYINGLYNQVDCAVCGTNNIRINGMEGPYTSILIDGMPVMGALASVYGLNGINPGIIRNLEVIKGPNSTLYGSQAMGGVINIITTSPFEAPSVDIETSSSTHGEHNFNFAYNPKIGNSHALFSGSAYLQDQFVDDNGDGFADLTQDIRISLYNKWEVYRKSGKPFTIAAKYYFEDRMGGLENFSRSLRGSEQIYGESIYTNRFELLSTYELPFETEIIRWDASVSYHDQDSYYGTYHYVADQQTYFSNLIWDKKVRRKGNLLTGLSIRYDRLTQLFDGTRLNGGSSDNRFVPAVFSQYDHTFSDSFRALAGVRLDHHTNHGFIFSPRLNLKASPGSHTTMRFNIGTGFRIVNLFTEEHESMTGSREVIVEEALNPERSVNLTFNLNQIVDVGPSVMNWDIDLYYTRFSNQIIPDYDTPNQILYRNLDGFAVSRGLAISMAHNFIAPLTYTVGVTFQNVFSVENDIKERLPFAPDFNAVFSLTYRFLNESLVADYTSRLIGKMKLPEYPNRDDISSVFSEHNLKLTKKLNSQLEIYVAGKNLFNYIQRDAIIAPDRPFSDDFATDYVFGPLQGRRLMGGIKYSIN